MPTTPTKKLPRRPLAVLPIPVLPVPKTVYEKYLRALKDMNLRLGDDPAGRPRVRGLAAILTVIRYGLNAEQLFRQARNRAVEAVEAINRLRNGRRPWPARLVNGARVAVEQLLADEVLLVWQTVGALWPAPPGQESPGEAWIQGFLGELGECPGPSQGELLIFASGIEEHALMHVGPTTSLFFAVPGIDCFVVGGERELRSSELATYLRWHLMEYLRDARGSRRAIGFDTDLIIANLLPDLANERQAKAADVRLRAVRRFFDWGSGKRPRELAEWLQLWTLAWYADRFEALGKEADKPAGSAA